MKHTWHSGTRIQLLIYIQVKVIEFAGNNRNIWNILPLYLFDENSSSWTNDDGEFVWVSIRNLSRANIFGFSFFTLSSNRNGTTAANLNDRSL